MRWAGFSPAKFVTHANILTSYHSTSVSTFASLLYERSSTACDMHFAHEKHLFHKELFGRFQRQNFHEHNAYRMPASSVPRLSPVIFSAQILLTRSVSCYALFNRWLLLSQLPDCLGDSTSFPTERGLGTLDGDLGCFPFERGA